MHVILGDLSGFTGALDSAVSNMTDLSRIITKHVNFKPLSQTDTHKSQVTASLDETFVLMSRHQAEQQAHAFLEVFITTLNLAC
jgi:hypothetical protein